MQAFILCSITIFKVKTNKFLLPKTAEKRESESRRSLRNMVGLKIRVFGLPVPRLLLGLRSSIPNGAVSQSFQVIWLPFPLSFYKFLHDPHIYFCDACYGYSTICQHNNISSMNTLCTIIIEHGWYRYMVQVHGTRQCHLIVRNSDIVTETLQSYNYQL